MASLEQRRDILKGRVDLNQLPPMQSRTVRVFVSSSSSELDMKAEREALATLVKPKLKKECLERYGIDFQMIDLRRNVPDKIVGQLNMRQLIAHEIKKCQDLSIGINFVALIGQKYGHTVLPPTVPMDTFTKLERVMTDNSEALQMMEHCYFLDENKIPAEYVLRTKQEILQSMSFVTQSMTDWTTINKFLSRSIREAAERARAQKLITENEFTTFVESEFSQQITDGLIKTPTTDNISFNFVINRIIQDVADHLDDPVVGDLIDVLLDEDDNVTVIDSFAANRLNSIKNSIKLNSEDTINLNVEWKSSSGNVDSNADVIVKKSQAFDEFESDSSDRHKTYEMDKAVNVDVYNHKEYINDLCKTFEHEIKKRIHKTLLTIGLQPKIEPLLSEVMYHLRVGLDCTHTLENRENCMSKIDAYVFDPNSAPLIVVGETGMGKSAILTETIHRTRRSLCDSVVIYREFGLTESSKYLQSTLITINQQIAEVLGKRYKAPLDFYTLVLDFQNYIYTWDSKTPLLLLLDGIENLKSDHNPCSLKWLPANLPSNVRVIITVPNKDHPILQSAKIMYGNEPLMLANFGSKEMMFIILEWLADAKMKLSDRQHQYARLGMRNPSSPLFLNLFFQELCKFRSYDFVNLVDNIFTTQSVIHKRFQKLEETYSACFVKHVLSIIALSKEGVTEHELEDILNMDGRLIEYLLLHAYCEKKKVPTVLLSGLLKDLGPLIKIKQLYGSHLLMVSNEQVLEICKIIYINDVEFKLYVHSLISDFFIGYSSLGKK